MKVVTNLGTRSNTPILEHPRLVTAILASSTLTYAISQTMVIPALSQIRSDFGVDSASSAWVMTGFFVSSAICTGIMGRLGDMFGHRQMLLVTLGTYGLGALLSALSPSLFMLVASRVIMGAGAGMVPLAYAIARDQLEQSRISRAMGSIAMMIGLGAGIGMVLGGVMVDRASWRASFLLAATLSLVAFVLTVVFVPESSNRSPARVDGVGAGLLALGLGGVLLAISRGAVWGWGDHRTVLLWCIGNALLALLIVVESKRSEPLLHVPTLVLRPVLFTNIASFMMGAGQVAVSILVVQVAQLPVANGGLGTSASAAGLVIVPYSITMVAGSQIAGRSVSRFGGRVILMTGAALATAGLAGLAITPVTLVALGVLAAVSGLGIGMTLVAPPYLLSQSVHRSRTGEANGANTIARAVGQTLGTQVTATVVAASAIAGNKFPSVTGYSAAFLLSTVACAVAIVSGLTIPRLISVSVQVPPRVDAHRLAGRTVASNESDDLIRDVIP